SRRQCDGRVYGGLEFDRGQPAQCGLSAAAVIGAFDPGDDGNAQLVAGGPAALVQHVLLQQGKETFHCGIVASSADSAHRPDQAVAAESTQEFPATELTAAVGVDNAAGDISAHLHGVL